MKPSTLEALKFSIAKWERNAVAGDWRDVDYGSHSCPLCHKFLKGNEDQPCSDCPVAKVTGDFYCLASPYNEVAHAMHSLEGDPNHIEIFELNKLCQAEADFLKSLLPAVEEP